MAEERCLGGCLKLYSTNAHISRGPGPVLLMKQVCRRHCAHRRRARCQRIFFCLALKKASLRGSVRCTVQTGVGRGPRDRHWRLEKDVLDGTWVRCALAVVCSVDSSLVVVWDVPQCLVVHTVD